MKSELLRIITGAVLFALALTLDLLKIEILPTVIYIITLILTGFPVFRDAIRGLLRRDFLDEKFLMCIASIGAMIIGEMTEGVAVMLFFLVGEYFEHKATRAARNSIRSLMEIKPDTARVIIDGEECESDAEDVEIGSVILIRPGERVPLDSVILSGEAEIDSSMLTGESVPVAVGVGDTIESGVILLGSVVTARTIRSCEDSRASRILELVEEASDRKSREESFITSFSRYYTPTVIVLALLMATVPALTGLLEWNDSIYRALSFLVVSCPCALVISVPMAFFGGIGGGAKVGVLYKGGNIFSAVAAMKSIVFDKTGTLTSGEFALTELNPENVDEKYFLKLIASCERNSNHPIAKGIASAVSDYFEVTEQDEIAGKGVVASVDGKRVAVGNSSLMKEMGIDVPEVRGEGVVFVSIDGKYRGYVILRDKIKPEAKAMIERLRRLGVKHTCILSGDREDSVRAVAEELGIDEYHSEMLPEDKYKKLEELIEANKRGTAYVGDGINDAPCLARADVGIAMGERGSDSAIESSDVVIMSDKLDKIPLMISSARKTVRIAKENIVFAIGVKLLALVLVALNVFGMWLAVVADVGVAVVAILNSMRTLRVPSRY
ncbi:MAG: cadmium-translocating P-type ATPase [Clostridia bacterium]|nr:cadmium-translocating P-type ATPase [Clostridia bacterium]